MAGHPDGLLGLRKLLRLGRRRARIRVGCRARAGAGAAWRGGDATVRPIGNSAVINSTAGRATAGSGAAAGAAAGPSLIARATLIVAASGQRQSRETDHNRFLHSRIPRFRFLPTTFLSVELS